jgi:hypothetical protein
VLESRATNVKLATIAGEFEISESPISKFQCIVREQSG